jgi:hypothetical protein
LNISTLSRKVDIGGLSTNTETSAKLGLKIGGVVDIPLSQHFFFQPGAFFSMKGGQNTYSFNLLGQTSKTVSSTNLSYIEIPLNLGAKVNVGDFGSVFATVGPYVAYAVGGSNKVETFLNDNSQGSTKSDIKFGSENTETKPLDYGVNVSAGYKFPFGLYGRLQYGMGLGNLSNANNTTTKNNVFGVSVGLTF